jgi:hypothetical protein
MIKNDWWITVYYILKKEILIIDYFLGIIKYLALNNNNILLITDLFSI